MNYCPNCGKLLVEYSIGGKNVKKCNDCSFVDWDNWAFVSCVVVAYNERNNFLMVELKGDEAGKLTFPGGYRELGETLEDAAKREFNEETGMTINNLSLFKTYVKDSQRLVWVVFKADIKSFDFKENDEVRNIFFYSLDSKIDDDKLRGNLTRQLLQDLVKGV